MPTEIDTCLLGLLLVFLPSATIFTEEFRGRVDGFLQRTGLDKIQEGGGFFASFKKDSIDFRMVEFKNLQISEMSSTT